uniref:Anaphase-promoting complex subunit 11 RING-H2 finger domain-containing protein n=1 Tax=Timema douglasi TaxID=61478 RepID=A0A7R8VRK9_TIMDO|nr:unnamed protein product [Timema douglasi]
MKVTIKEWTGVATWRWVANDDNCGICRMPFDGCCPDCKVPGDDCPLVWSQCSHCFHIHCIMKWLTSQVHYLTMFCAMFVTSLGPMFTLFPHPLYHEVAQLTTSPPSVPNVPSRVEV